MTEKDLLLRDLSARLPYGVICEVSDIHIRKTYELTGIQTGGCEFEHNGAFYGFDSFSIKPYLKPTTMITSDEITVIAVLYSKADENPHLVLDWFLSHHFDIRGLIEKGLAIEVTEDNNPYKQEVGK